MTLLTPPPGDPRTPAEYTYDMERSGQMYAMPSLAEQFAEVFSDRTLTPEQIGQRCAEIASAAMPKRHELPAFEEWGQLSNGAEIWGSTDHTDPTGRCGVVHADVGDFRLTAQDEPNLIDIEGENVRIEGATLADLVALANLLATDLPRQMLASAIAYGRGDAEPPSPRAMLDDLLIGHIDGFPVTASYGTDNHELFSAVVVWNGILISTDGESYINLPTDNTVATIGDVSLEGWQAVRKLAETNVVERLMALARANRMWPPTPPSPEIVVEHWYHDGNEDGDLVPEPRGPLAYVDYKIGVEDREAYARISFPADRTQRVSTAFAGYSDVSIEMIERAIVNMQTLLSDPRVQALRRGEALGLDKAA